jgi:hypothetical protein
MLNLSLVQDQLTNYYGGRMQRESVICMNQKEAFVLIETKSTYEVVLVSDHTEQPIGGIDLLVQQKVDKTGDAFEDMAAMLNLIHVDIEKGYGKVEELVFAAINEIKDSIEFGKRNLPLLKSKL